VATPGGDDGAGRLAVRWYPLGSGGAARILRACGAWRCVMPARRSGAKFCLAV